MRKTRIVKVEEVGGAVYYKIQERFLWILFWTDCMRPIGNHYFQKNYFRTKEEAMENLKFFDGTKDKEEVVYEN